HSAGRPSRIGSFLGRRSRRSIRTRVGNTAARGIRARPGGSAMARMNARPSPLDHGSLARRIRAGETTVGTFAGLASATSAEVMAAAGLDWVLVDLEHGGGAEDLIGAVAARTGGYATATLARVESAERI